MSKILSQDEVDALLQGMSDGEVPSESEESVGQPSDVRSYDLLTTERRSRLGMPTYEVVMERFAQIFQDSIGAFIRRKVEFTKTGSELLRFNEFLRSLVVPTSLHVWRPQPLRGMALLVLGSNLVFNLVEIFFGGKGGTEFKIEGREFTQIEQRLVGKLVQVALRDLARAWERVHPVRPHIVRSEINPQFAKVVPPDENVVVTTFTADLHSAKGKMQMCVPIASLEPIRAQLSASFQESEGAEVDSEWQRQLARRLHQVPLEMVVELGRTKVTGRRLLELKPGDVITLDRHVSSPILGLVAGVPKIEGFVGLLQGTKAFQVSGRYEN